jgi:stage II sporulation protein D
MKARILVCIALFALPAGAHAATRFTIRGAGFGHGVGMSQYGAYGYALHGWSYDQILGHYYTGTTLGTARSTTVRVLLQGSVSSSSFSGATSASGRHLNPATTYYVKHGPGSGEVDLASASGHRLKHLTGVLRVRGSKLHLGGVGVYRHELEYRASGVFGVQAVNALPMESYVRGVVSRESPSSWPAAALAAQAVAARTYALTTSKGGNGYDQYADTRSQVYGGVDAETAATDAATKATAHQVVTYDGKPVTTYFFSTSGGRTENVEYSVLGDEPLPWLKSVKDPYDNLSPKHRWGPFKMSMGSAAAKLSGLVKGSFKGISVTKRGVSPRIVTADVVGTGGRTHVSGATLRARFGLYDTWAYFTSISSGSAEKAQQDRALTGADPQTRAAVRAGRRLQGRVFPGGKGAVVVIQRRSHGRWRQVGEATTDRAGRYAFLADRAGRYRVRYLVDVGPVVALH